MLKIQSNLAVLLVFLNIWIFEHKITAWATLRLATRRERILGTALRAMLRDTEERCTDSQLIHALADSTPLTAYFEDSQQPLYNTVTAFYKSCGCSDWLYIKKISACICPRNQWFATLKVSNRSLRETLKTELSRAFRNQADVSPHTEAYIRGPAPAPMHLKVKFLLIGNHTSVAFDWCHFWWPWSIFEGHFSLGCHFHVHFSNFWQAFASRGLPAIAELLVLY